MHGPSSAEENHAHFDAKKEEDVDLAVARFFFHDHIAFMLQDQKILRQCARRLGSMVHRMFPHLLRHCASPSFTRRDMQWSKLLKTWRRLW